ncbi:MAG: type II toxin-antitoxin system RelE/ParE family toxin [Caldilineaceae bacterium]|nr:type II toxin-antitoxin system RelE/ParE family toxin [Caldilineaceae bacterium]
MPSVRQTEAFERWFEKLRDRRAKARIAVRIRRLSLGNPGDVRRVGKSVSELRIDYGPGYRVYLVERSLKEVLLLNGGVKRTQEQDILRAHEIARRIRKDDR